MIPYWVTDSSQSLITVFISIRNSHQGSFYSQHKTRARSTVFFGIFIAIVYDWAWCDGKRLKMLAFNPPPPSNAAIRHPNGRWIRRIVFSIVFSFATTE